MLENVVPPRVCAEVESHVVGNNVENQPHSTLAQSVGEGLEVLFGSQILIQPAVIADVVAVRASFRGLQQRRGVAGRDPERVEIRNEVPGVLEAELRTELQSVRACGLLKRAHDGWSLKGKG